MRRMEIWHLFIELYSGKSEIQIFHNTFLKPDISLNISNTALKCGISNLCNVQEESVSQFFVI